MQGHFMTVIIPSASFSIILKQCHSKKYLPQQKELFYPDGGEGTL